MSAIKSDKITVAAVDKIQAIYSTKNITAVPDTTVFFFLLILGLFQNVFL
jgi:hypothetical protein